MYFNVSGGAFSIETLVVEVGPSAAMILLLVVPVAWAVPEALIVGELASMLPLEGGYYQWVSKAFGKFWAFQSAWLTWLYSVADMALYPALFAQYLGYFLPDIGQLGRWLLALAFVGIAGAINVRGALPAARVAVIAGVVVLGSFAFYCVSALPTALHRWGGSLPGGTPVRIDGLAVGLSIAVWNYSGWGIASTLQGEVLEPTSTYPRALWRALPLVAASYLIPITIALAASDWREWGETGWPAIALLSSGKAGPISAALLAVAGSLSAFALFSSLLLAYSRLPFAVALDRLLPTRFASVDQRGTPRTAVLLSAGLYSTFALLPFAELVVLDFFVYGMVLVLQLASLVVLRNRDPGLRGAFRIPLRVGGIVLLAALPTSLLVVAIVFEIAQRGLDGWPLRVTVAGTIIGIVLYFTMAYFSRRKPHAVSG